jgi:signal transduction histidine kinase
LRTSLAVRLTLAFLLVALTATLLVAVFIRSQSAGQLNQLVVEQARNQFAGQVSAYYAANGSLEGIYGYLRPGMAMGSPAGGAHGRREGGAGQGIMMRDRDALFGLADPDGMIIIPVSSYTLGETIPAREAADRYPVQVDGETIGYVLVEDAPPRLYPEEQAFLARANRALLLSAAGALLLALIVGILLARTLTRPLRTMTHAARQIAAGNLSQQVEVSSQDELGELAEAFNQMSQDLETATTLRRRMTADIAHELRTPLTVISGYIESMQDGVLEATPQRLAILAQEVDHLQHLVSDLHTLSKADAGELVLNLQHISPQAILERAAAAFRLEADRKGVSLQMEAAPGLPMLNVDEERMAQIMNNLVNNALRHTSRGGKIVLSATSSPRGVTLHVRDTGEGIASEDLPHIFERLYRADQNRQQNNSESGLGLAITKALVESHGGRITAASQPGQGADFMIWLPVAQGESE